jgi:hypothetical protein
MPSGMPIDYTLLPEHLREGMRAYIERGIKPGGFLLACLGDRLGEAACRADEVSAVHLRDIGRFLMYYAPNGSWGSDEAVGRWIETHRVRVH